MASTSASGSASAAGDLHLKMSKKIAQLTKVIFHLNTRNEDFQLEFAYLKQTQAQELAAMAHDAATKVRSVQDQLSKETAARVTSEQRAAKDKQQHAKEMATFQHKALAKQTAQEEEFQRHVASLEAQLTQTKQAFSDRVQQLTQLVEAQAQRAQANASASAAAVHEASTQRLEELRKQHAKEVADLVTMANAKYNTMLADQLREQDSLREALAQRQSEHAQYRAEQERDLRARLSAQEASAKQLLDETKSQLVGKMERLLRDAEQLRTQEAQLRQDKEQLQAKQSASERQIQALQLQVTQARQESQSVRKDADAGILQVQQALTLANQKVTELAQELDANKALLQAKDQAVRQAQKQIEALQGELAAAQAKMDESNVQWQQQLQSKENKMTQLQAELMLARQQTTQTESTLHKQLQRLETLVATKEQELLDLQQKLAATDLARAQAVKDKDKLNHDMKQRTQELEQALTELKQQHAKTLQDLQENHVKAIEALKTSHAQQLAELARQAQQHSSASIEKMLTLARAEHQSALTKQQTEFEAQLESVKRAAQDELTQQSKQSQAVMSQKDSERAVFEKKIRDLEIQIQKLTEQLQAAQRTQDSAVKAAQQAQKAQDEQHEKKYKELQAMKDAALTRASADKEKLVKEHLDKVKALVLEHERHVSTLRSEWEREQSEQLSSVQSTLTATYEAQMREWADRYAAAEEAASLAKAEAGENARAASENAQQQHEELLGRLFDLEERSRQQRSESEQSQQAELDALRATHANELQVLAQRAEEHLVALQRKEQERLDTVTKQLLWEHEQQHVAQARDHAAALQAQQEALDGRCARELLAAQAEMTQRLRELRTSKDNENAQALQAAQTQHDSRYALLQQQYDTILAALTLKTSEHAASANDVERLSALLDARTREMLERVTSLERTHREDVDTLKQAAKQDLDRLLEENLAETKQLSDHFETTRQLMVDQVTALKRTVGEWEVKYAQRDSRPEDLARIADLERLVLEKEALVRQTLDEMAFFKRELLNREEMYNKTFARTPNVGVLQVLKPHVQLQHQMQLQSQGSYLGGVGTGVGVGVAPQSKRKTKPAGPGGDGGGGLQRRNSERAPVPAAPGTKKSLPPLTTAGGISNQFGLN
ncbi:TPA: hypothetical protein N0F65_000495 [Lagenidium giganteum]|uniref:Protein FAM184A/B N-terminal domain-containing protein n=1 Tax=Lagenidium giganteum TaxID=4803 RepID=A0AAV2Z0P7_9STRA|nr:TPA: hypothetical protein N0F65_000495 [Lagenidium giganteum]